MTSFTYPYDSRRILHLYILLYVVDTVCLALIPHNKTAPGANLHVTLTPVSTPVATTSSKLQSDAFAHL